MQKFLKDYLLKVIVFIITEEININTTAIIIIIEEININTTVIIIIIEEININITTIINTIINNTIIIII